jgi:hypothetical protein
MAAFQQNRKQLARVTELLRNPGILPIASQHQFGLKPIVLDSGADLFLRLTCPHLVGHREPHQQGCGIRFPGKSAREPKARRLALGTGSVESLSLFLRAILAWIERRDPDILGYNLQEKGDA